MVSIKVGSIVNYTTERGIVEAAVVKELNLDGSVDIQLYVPGPQPQLVKNVCRGPGPGTWEYPLHREDVTFNDYSHVNNGKEVMSDTKKDYPHYYKEIPVGVTHIDIYAVLSMWHVDDPAIQHAIKKLMCAGQRGEKERKHDLTEAVVSIERAIEMEEQGFLILPFGDTVANAAKKL